MLTVLGYSVSNRIYTGRRSQIYRAVRERDGRAVVLKMLCEPGGSHSLLHELTLGQKVDHEHVVRYLELIEHEDQWLLVEEDFGATGLDQLLPRKGLPLENFLDLAVQVSAGLAAVHAEGVVHKDVKPSNLVWNREQGTIKLTDFGIAGRLREEQIQALGPRRLQGSLPYMSPEQTGRVERTLDSRSDLYSLGATFYEMLVGRPPFTADDPLELIHAHIARSPTPPRNLRPEIPEMLSDIVLLLLRKDVEDRYQTARGLQADLRNCRDQWRRRQEIAPFEPAQEDVSESFKLPQKLYGREAEIRTVVETFERGTRSLLVVDGYSGTGKTSLVHELRLPVTARQGHFVHGKNEQYQTGAPYHALGQALDELIDLLSSRDPETTATWRRKIAGALGRNAGMFTEVVPSLERLLGEQPAPPEVKLNQARNRFQFLLRKLLRVLASPEHPLVIFLDDLQWADHGSLDFLTDLTFHEPLPDLLVVVSYRRNEVSPDHPLVAALSEIEQHGSSVTLELRNLTRSDVARLLADTLSASQEEVGALADLVHAKTLGNPFFTREFLKSLHADGLLSFEPAIEQPGWLWDLEQIRAREITDNVVDLLTEKMNRIAPAARRALEYAACIGREFELETLVALGNAADVDLSARQLWPAIEEGLIRPLDPGFSSLQLMDQAAGRFRFAHDRIHQAAYSLLATEQRQKIHLKIARLEHQSRAPAGDDRLFEVVDHFDRAVRWIQAEEEIVTVAELNLRAGCKAKQAAAFPAAINYLRTGTELLPEKLLAQTLTTDHPDFAIRRLLFELHRELAEVEIVSGRFSEAKRRTDLLLDASRELEEKLTVRLLQIEHLVAQGQALEATRVGREALKPFGIDLPVDEEDLNALFETEFAAMPTNLQGRSITELANSPPMTDATQRQLMRLLSSLGFAAFLANEITLLNWALTRRANLSMVYGIHKLSATAFAGFALCAALIRFGDHRLAWRYATLAADLAERLDDPGAQGRAHLILAYAEHWRGPLAAIDQRAHHAYLLCCESGDLNYAGVAFYLRMGARFYRGLPLHEIDGDVRRLAPFFQRFAGNYFESHIRPGLMQPVALLLGRTRSEASFDSEDFDEERFLSSFGRAPAPRTAYCIAKVQCLYLLGRADEALKYVDEFEMIGQVLQGQPGKPQVWLFFALTLIKAIERDGERADRLKLLDRLQEDLRSWSEHAPDHRYKLQLILAERARLRGELRRALSAYKEAIRTAEESGYPHHEALAHELFAHFWLSEESCSDYARLHLQSARTLYDQWGAAVKVRQIEEQHRPLLVPQQETATTGSEHLDIDLSTVMKAARAISGEIRLEALLEKILRIVVEAAGAERGRLALEREERPFVAVDVTDLSPGGVVVARAQEGVEPEEIARDVADLAAPKIVEYVRESAELLVLGDAAHDERFADDAHVVSRRVRSVLCIPVRTSSGITGFLYLENNLISFAFTEERVEILQMLLAQATISLENAVLVEELTHEVAERQRQNAELERFAYTVSHELKSPLVTIRGFTGALQRDLERGATERIRQDSERILRAAETMQELLDGLLQLSRIGRLDAVREETSLGDLVQEAADLLAGNLVERGVEVVIESDLPAVVGERIRLLEVFCNLLENAAKFMGDQSSPRIEIGRRVLAQGDDEHVVLFVRDNGIGIDPLYHERIFRLFEHLDPEVEGTGVGLALVRRILEHHGGRLWVESEGLGKGSTFWIRLPFGEQ